jgi:hypothetical protein
MKLHTIGDCHADIPWYKINASDTQFEEIRNNGHSLTISRIGVNKLDVLNISTFYSRGNPIPTIHMDRIKKCPYDHYYNIEDGDAVLFSFGEIDARLIFSSSQYSNMWQEMIDTTVALYFDVIKTNVENFNHLYVMVDNIIPPTKREDFPTYPCSDGTNEHRKIVTQYMNKKYKEYCEKYNYIFFDTYNKYSDKDGFINFKLSNKSNHIENSLYLIEFLNSLKFGENKTNYKRQKVLKSVPLFVPEPISEPLSNEIYIKHEDISIPVKTFSENVKNSNKYLKSKHIEYRDMKR